MPYFAVQGLDRPGMDETRDALRPGHRVRLRQHDHPVTVHVGGPLLDEAGVMCGSLFVIEAEDRAAVERFMAGDPYVEAGIFATLDIRHFAWGLGQPGETAHG